MLDRFAHDVFVMALETDLLLIHRLQIERRRPAMRIVTEKTVIQGRRVDYGPVLNWVMTLPAQFGSSWEFFEGMFVLDYDVTLLAIVRQHGKMHDRIVCHRRVTIGCAGSFRIDHSWRLRSMGYTAAAKKEQDGRHDPHRHHLTIFLADHSAKSYSNGSCSPSASPRGRPSPQLADIRHSFDRERSAMNRARCDSAS